MQVKFFLTLRELRQVAQQATLIDGNINEESIMSITIDDHRIAVDVPNMARSLQREVIVDRAQEAGLLMSEPAAHHHATH